MKTITTLLIVAATAVSFTACKETKPNNNIIASKPAVKAPATPVRMQPSDHKETVEWIGQSYTIEISRRCDTSLPVIVDDSGNKYYDNRISVKVTRHDGTLFFNKVFTKGDFADQISENYLKRSALLGIVVDHTDDNSLILAASVGAPDVLSDDYMPMIISVSRMGAVSVSKDERAELEVDE